MTRVAALTLGTAGLVLLAAMGPAAARPTADRDTALTGAQAHAILARVAAAPAPGDLVNDEVGVAELDPTGLPERALLISRVTATGAAREVVDPASQTNVRYLDRLGRPEVTPEGVLLTVGGQDPSALTQGRFDIPLPVALHVEYALDGAVLPAADVPGSPGELAVTYTLTNTAAQQTELRFVDAAGSPQTSTRPVFAPFQGSLTVTLPDGVQLVDPGAATRATDDLGRTVLRWMVSLHPPVSAPVQAFTVVMRTDRAAVPGAEVVLQPVLVEQDPAEEFSSTLLSGVSEGNEELFGGLTALDAGAAGLAGGARQLALGMDRLAGGAQQAAGASDDLADGIDGLAGGAGQLAGASDDLADGIGDLSGGARELAAGSAQLADALDRSVGGAQDLAAATAALAAAAGGNGQDPVAPLIAGGEQIEAGLAEAAARVGGSTDPVLDPLTPLPPDGDDVCPPAGTAPPDDDCVTIYQGVRLLRDSLALLTTVADSAKAQADAARSAVDDLLADLASIRDDVVTAAQGAAELYATLCAPEAPQLDPASCTRLKEVADTASSALATGRGALPTVEELVAAVTVLERQAAAIDAALRTALASTQRLLDGVAALGAALGPGTSGQPGLAAGMSALNAGLRQLSTELAASRAQLSTALAGVAQGNATLAEGLGAAASGAGDVADGSSALAQGSRRAAAGAEGLAGGASTLAQGAGAAATGADQLASGVAGLAEGTGAAAGASEELASGAHALQQDGTAPAAQAVLDGSVDPAEAQAWLAAADARAADALPYGAPEGAIGTVTYLFTLDPVAAPRSLWERITAMFRP